MEYKIDVQVGVNSEAHAEAIYRDVREAVMMRTIHYYVSRPEECIDKPFIDDKIDEKWAEK